MSIIGMPTLFSFTLLGVFNYICFEYRSAEKCCQIYCFTYHFVLYDHAYFSRYYNMQKFNNVAYMPIAGAIKYFTKPDDILLIYGFDWSSEIPYYSQRRALMDRWNLPFESSKFQIALKNLDDEKISAMVLRRGSNVNGEFIAERTEKLNLSPQPVFRDQDIELYVARTTVN